MIHTKAHIKKILLSLLIVIAKYSHTAVNMKTASFNETWNDINIGENKNYYSIERRYNSRSIYNGLFGLGWCSNIESHLKFKENSIEFYDCENFMMPIRFDRNDEANVLTNSEFPEYKVIASIKVTTLIVNDQSFMKFNSQGQLIQMINKNGYSVVFNYKNNQLVSIADASNSRLLIKYLATNKIESIQGSTNIRATYKYEGNNLTESRNSNHLATRFEYNDDNNLIAINGAQNLVILYDSLNDQTLKVTDENNCEQVFQFDNLNALLKTSSVKKYCNKKLVKQLEYNFHLATKEQSSTVLKVTVSDGNKSFILVDKTQIPNTKQRSISGNYSKEL